ncbi:MAG TPA: hypothetical protein VF003_11850 [Pseudonocardiaceae bacterium]
MSFVVHQFMDAADVAPAWEKATDPRVRAAQERLASCHYAVAHLESGELLPACVQHCVLDPVDSVQLRKLLLSSTPVPREIDRPVSLAGLVLPDACTGRAVDLGALPGTHVLTAVRHQY